MNLKQLIPLGIIGGALLLLTQKKTPTDVGAIGGIEKTREVAVSSNGQTFKIEVPKESLIKHEGNTINVYRQDGTLQATYDRNLLGKQAGQTRIIDAPASQLLNVNMETKLPDGRIIRVPTQMEMKEYIDPKTGTRKSTTNAYQAQQAGLIEAPPKQVKQKWSSSWGWIEDK